MKYYWGVWIWENGNKSTDLTKYVTVPIFLEPHLDETLGTGEIILDSYPDTTAFAPKTKIRIERYLTKDFSDSPTTYDYIVDNDQVEYYTGCPEICCHRIELIEPSAVAQNMHVDNISLTRELNDVDLNYKTVLSSTETVNLSKGEIIGSGYERPNLSYSSIYNAWELDVTSSMRKSKSIGSYNFTNSFRYVWSDTSSIDNLIENQNALEENEITFTIPTLTCYYLNKTAPTKLFECPVRTKVTRYTLLNGNIVNGSEEFVVSQLYNPIDIQDSVNHIMYNENGKVGLVNISTESYRDTFTTTSSITARFFPASKTTKFPAMINLNDTNHTEKSITFTTDKLSQTEINDGKSYRYSITCTIEPYESGAAVQSFTYVSTATYSYAWSNWLCYITGLNFDYYYVNFAVTQNSLTKPSTSSISISTSVYATDMQSPAQPNPFLVKPQKYSCYNLIRKALLTIDAQIIDNTQMGLDPIYDEDYNDIGIQYPIIIDSSWITKLKETQLYETIFENKNLWEIFLQVGYYLHAIPQLKFATDETDRFVLSFRQLGGTTEKNNESTKITIFNSLNLSEYYTQLDSYVTNIFSPQNEVEEWLVCKTSDSTYLVSNDTAELQTKYNITQIDEFDIEYNGTTLSALDYIFEETVYSTLSANTNLTPAKWKALYYTMGDNKILGLTYTPPSTNNDALYALKEICGDLFGKPVDTDGEFLNLEEWRFNDLKFHIKYKTQDELRISQFKPNLYNFMKNSKYEKYPHHEQFYGQEDKIVDSERFSANLWGRLVRIANEVYQCQEYAEIGEEKEVGDLVQINNDYYYVTTIESEYYNDIILQKVSYSKNYNQISQIVTIPSEPRYYEISERSMVRREVRLMDFFLLTTTKNSTTNTPRFIPSTTWQEFIRNIIFTDEEQPVLPNFAWTRFKADQIREHLKEAGDIIDYSVLFPSPETEVVNGATTPKASSDHRDVIVSLLHFPLRNAIVFEWDMDDNFKAGDAVDTSISGEGDTADDAYYTLAPVRYCDVMGGADLFSFRLFNKTDWTKTQIQRLPLAEEDDYTPTESESIFLLPDQYSIGLDKDNREALSFNYQINLLTSDDDERNKFVIFSNIFGEKNGRLNMVLLNKGVSMFDETVELTTSTIVADNVTYTLEDTDDGAIEVKITEPADIDLSLVKSIVLYDLEDSVAYAYIAKNVGKLDDSEKLQSWYIYPVFAD